MNQTIEIIVAVRNEADAAGWFVDEILKLAVPSGFSLAVHFIEDGSTDDTVERLQMLQAKFPWVRYTCLEKGFGQIPAIIFGLSLSRTTAQILMDVDGTHPARLIPEMIQRFSSGAQIVQGFRRDGTRQGILRKWGAYLFRFGVLLLTGVDLRRQTVYYRLIGSKTRQEVLADPRSLYFFRIPLPRDPLRVQYVEFDYEERQLGQSKYPLPRLLKFAATGILSLMSTARLWAFSLGLAGLCVWATQLSPIFLICHPLIAWVLWKHWTMSHNQILKSLKVKTKGQVHACKGVVAQATK